MSPPESSIWQLFERLSDLGAEEQVRILDELPNLTPATRRRLEAMLAVSESSEARLQDVVGAGFRRMATDPPGAGEDAASHPGDEDLETEAFAGPGGFSAEIPRTLGPYRVLEEIGRGGLSTVYLAEREEPQMRVAIKVVRPDMASDELRERLRRERQILADLDHPNIARIFDGGTAENGAPYFVMEHIAGCDIDDFCEQRGLDLKERLELFLDVAAAVDFAHRNLVLHRDLKPSNILVTESGTPKLLDFGIAKLLQTVDDGQTATAELTLTRPGMQVFTPAYASPEQILGESLSTASDIYSLGVVLYELVAGARPHTFAAYNAIEFSRFATGPEPPPPSTHGRTRKGDLDNVVLMALRKDHRRRYGSVAQLADDIRRFLRGDAVTARKDTFSYRASKFIKRHKLAAASTALVFLTLLAAVVMTSWQAREAREARKIAEQNLDAAELQRARAENIIGFLTRLFEVSDPYQARGRTITAREMLDQGARRIQTELHEDPRLQADLMAVMGRVYRKLSLYTEAQALTEESLRLTLELEEAESKPVVALQRDLARIRSALGDCSEAIRMLTDIAAVEKARQRTGQDLAETLAELGEAEAECDHIEPAEEALRQALSLRRKHFGPLSEQALETEQRLAQLFMASGRYEEAIDGLQKIVDRRRKSLGEDHPALAEAQSDLALALHYNGQLDQAARMYAHTLEEQKRLLGDRHEQVTTTLYNSAILHRDRGELESAQALFAEVLERTRQTFGDSHPLAADCLLDLGRLARRRGELDRAEELMRQALDIRLSFFGPESPEVAKDQRSLAVLLAETDPAAAEIALLENIETTDRVLGRADYRAAYSRLSLANLLLKSNRPKEAEPFIREALEIRLAALPQGHHDVALAQAYLGQCLVDQERFDEALPVLEESLRLLSKGLGDEDPRTQRAVDRLRRARERTAEAAAAD